MPLFNVNPIRDTRKSKGWTSRLHVAYSPPLYPWNDSIHQEIRQYKTLGSVIDGMRFSFREDVEVLAALDKISAKLEIRPKSRDQYYWLHYGSFRNPEATA